jgi:hypothetical protein
MVAMIADIFTGLAPIILVVWVGLLALYLGTIYAINRGVFKQKNDANLTA